MNHNMSLFEAPFKKIKSGKKIVEIRLFDKKRTKIEIGDTITFTKLPNKQDKLTVEVVGLSQFRSFPDMYTVLNKSAIGHPQHYTLEDQILGVRKIYPEEKEKKFGVLGIHIALVQ